MADGTVGTAFHKHGFNPFIKHQRPEWKIAGGDGFGKTHHIGPDAPGPRAEPGTRPPETGDDLIGDQENIVFVAQRAQCRPQTWRRHQDAASTEHRFCDKSRNAVCTLIVDLLFDLPETDVRQLVNIFNPEWIVVKRWERQLDATRQQWLITLAETVIAVD